MLRHVPSLSLPVITLVLVCGFRCDPEVPIGQDRDSGAASDAGPGSMTCPGDNPAGCLSDADCGGAMICAPGSRPSACSCDPATGTWACTADLSGGDCVAPMPCGDDPSSECTSSDECGAGLRCRTGVRPSACACDPATGTWTCTADLAGGECTGDGCLDPTAPGVTYHGTSPADCARITFMCGPGEVAFGDDCGCGCQPAPAPDCGTTSCDYTSQYCEVATGGAPGSPTSYACMALPSSCGATPSCAACFPAGPGTCEERPEGLRYTIALP